MVGLPSAYNAGLSRFCVALVSFRLTLNQPHNDMRLKFDVCSISIKTFVSIGTGFGISSVAYSILQFQRSLSFSKLRTNVPPVSAL